MINIQLVMRRLFLVIGCWLLLASSSAQTISHRLQKAFQQFESDSQLKHAISSLYVIDAETGQVIFDKNSQVGLAGASTQKIITASTAFELLGKDFKYKTEFGYCTDPEDNKRFWINPSGDPTFGSWRWETTKEKQIINEMGKAIKADDLKACKGVMMNAQGWNTEQIPDGWIWQDIGNYYGAGAGILNWRENQYDLFLKSGSKIGDPVSVVETDPVLYSENFVSETISAAKGTGDNAYIYFPVHGKNAVVRGTIPVNEDRFKISGSMINPVYQFITTMDLYLKNKFNWTDNDFLLTYGQLTRIPAIVYTYYSPSLDSIVYWFLKKSINLYGEALVKTFAYEKQGLGSTDSGVAIVRRFWKEKGIDENELNIYDGSGLSPLNRITTHAQVEVLKYAKTRDWYPYFYDALPEYNSMKMKSGTINDVKGFCGYQKSKDGRMYIFSFLVNNYNGRTSAVVNKMYKVLDELK